MQLSRELDYGVRAMVVLTTHDEAVLSKRKIATAFKIPINFLALILPKLVRAGLVESLPGPHGGYRLAKAPSTISLYDVIRAIDRDFYLSRCLDPKRGCEVKGECPVTDYWHELQRMTEAFLHNVTFDHISKKQASKRTSS